MKIQYSVCSEIKVLMKLFVKLTKICKNIPTVITERSIIQFLASIYDPFGLINPLIVKYTLLVTNNVIII